MLFKIVPLSVLSSYQRADGTVFTGATGEPPEGGFTINDTYTSNSPSSFDIDTRFGGGYGTGNTGGFGDFEGPAWTSYSWYT
mmetsp:Transcript_40396/g.108414  ORF Transcript_40396/g.108414 Transcript_40396/m.108414 type:complete len:82 (-) Transcript_40396:192-437(-)